MTVDDCCLEISDFNNCCANVPLQKVLYCTTIVPRSIAIPQENSSVAGWPPSDVVVERRGDAWHVDVAFGKAQPRSEVWTIESLVIGVGTPRDLTLTGRIYGDNIDPLPTVFLLR
jgi:hypothetical protein